MQDEHELTIELEQECGGEEIAPIRVRPTIWSQTRCGGDRVVRVAEGTDYGVHETSLEAKVAQVLIQLRRGEAHITFDPATESVNVVVTARPADQGGPSVPPGLCPTGIFWLLGLMSADANGDTSPTPIPPAVGAFDLLHETAGHRLLADLCPAGDGRRLSGRRRSPPAAAPAPCWPISLRCSRYARATFSSIPRVRTWRPRPLAGPRDQGPPGRARLLTEGNRPRTAHRRAFRAPNACPVSRRIVRRDGAS